MSNTMRRKAGWSLLFSIWSAVLVLTADVCYGGYLLKLEHYDWAAPIYKSAHAAIGYSLANLGFVALHVSLPLALAGLLLGLFSFFQVSFVYKLIGVAVMLLSGAAIWHAAPGLLLTAAGSAFILLSPHTPFVWDKIFAAFVFLLPLSGLILCRIAGRRPKSKNSAPQDVNGL